jgi:septal ring factor EnvC (AmiA/AmiB activator)
VLLSAQLAEAQERDSLHIAQLQATIDELQRKNTTLETDLSERHSQQQKLTQKVVESERLITALREEVKSLSLNVSRSRRSRRAAKRLRVSFCSCRSGGVHSRQIF